MENQIWIKQFYLYVSYSSVLFVILLMNRYLLSLYLKVLPQSVVACGIDAQELARKISHILCALILASLPLSGAELAVPLAIGFSFLCLLTIFKRQNWMEFLYTKRKGTIIFPVGLILTSFFFYHQPYIFTTAMLILGFADPSAAFSGMRWGTSRYNGKSIVGFVCFFLICSLTIIASRFYHAGIITISYVGLALLISLVIAAGEFISRKGLDNLIVPLLSALLLNFI